MTARGATSGTESRRPIGERTRTAHHEAGHAVLGAAINDHPERVSIRGREGTLGRSAQKMLVGPTSLAQVYLAGFAAEHLLMCRRPRSFDVEVGLGLLAHLDPHLVETIDGVEATDGYGAVHQVLRTGVREVEGEIRAEVERLYGVARESLGAVWPTVKVVASASTTERSWIGPVSMTCLLTRTSSRPSWPSSERTGFSRLTWLRSPRRVTSKERSGDEHVGR